MTSQRIFNKNNIANNINPLSCPDPLWHLHYTRMKPLLSNNLRTLCSQTAWRSTFFCATLYIWSCKISRVVAGCSGMGVLRQYFYCLGLMYRSISRQFETSYKTHHSRLTISLSLTIVNNPNHSLYQILPPFRPNHYSLRKRGHPFQLLIINTNPLKSTFVNRCLFQFA